jgi:hypothetical protein
VRDDSDPFAELVELQPAWVKTFDLPGGDGAYWAILPNSDSVEIRAEVVQPTVNVWSFGVWYWPEALAVVLALLVLVTGRWWWFARKGKEPRCRKCRYELTNLKSDACPECGTALTPRNRVIGMRSRWRMALAPAALLLIGSAWWFGESHVPRHGWVSEKVQWHWAWDPWGDDDEPHEAFDKRFMFHQLHGGNRVHRIVLDQTGRLMSKRDRGCNWWHSFSDAERVWGRFPGSDTAWDFDEQTCEVVLYRPDGTITVVPDVFCGDLLGWYAENRIEMEVDGKSVTHTFLPDPTGDGWFILTDGRLTHRSFATGKLTVVHQFEQTYDDGYGPNWYMEPVPGGYRVVIYEALSDEMFLVDLESRQVIDSTKQLNALGDEGAVLFAIGHADSPLRDEILSVICNYWPILTQNYRYFLCEELTDSKEWQWRVGDLERGEWMYYLKFPEHQGDLAQITTGPGPRDVNVFFIDGGQLILAVYELPEAE